MSATAYLVGIIDTTTGTFRGASIFSEATPTLPGRLFPFTILQVSRPTLEEAEAALRAVWEAEESHPCWWWLRRFVVERGGEMPPNAVDLLREGAAHVCDHFDEAPIPRDLLGWVDRAQDAVRRLRGEA